MNYHVIWIGWQQGCKHVSRIGQFFRPNKTQRLIAVQNHLSVSATTSDRSQKLPHRSDTLRKKTKKVLKSNMQTRLKKTQYTWQFLLKFSASSLAFKFRLGTFLFEGRHSRSHDVLYGDCMSNTLLSTLPGKFHQQNVLGKKKPCIWTFHNKDTMLVLVRGVEELFRKGELQNWTLERHPRAIPQRGITSAN